jgi:hypothetical protein
MKSIRHMSVAISLALVGTAVLMSSASAEVLPTITFELPTYSIGSIDGQGGWAGSGGSAITPTYDQGVVSTTVNGFDDQAFRMSNAVSSGSFSDWPYSPSLVNEAGEASAQGGSLSSGSRQSHFEASFDIASAVPAAEQPGLGLGFSPDRGDGARMSLVRVRDEADGLVSFADYQSGVNEVGCATGTNFVNTIVASELERSAVHSIRIAMDFVDGPANDVVSVYVDDELVHVGTSWEDYFRECEVNPTRTVDSLLIRASGSAPATEDAGFLIDNLTLSSSPSTWSSPCVITTTPGTATTPTVYTLQANCTTDHTILVPQNAGGSVFDGNDFRITGVDPVGGHFLGAVVQAAAGSNPITVRDLTVRVSGLGDSCDGGDDRLRGILFDSVGGTITNNVVNHLKQGTNSGCQEGNAIEVRNAPFEKGNAPNTVVMIRTNTVTDYQKTGILVNGSVAATIRDNVATGAGPVNYIAQNGIQVGFGATARLFGNGVSGNDYTPPTVTACGLLIYKADGVGAQSKSGLSFVRAENDIQDNEKNICNFGKGGTFKPAS